MKLKKKNDILSLSKHTRTQIRKRASILLFKIQTLYSSAPDVTFKEDLMKQLKINLEDKDSQSL